MIKSICRISVLIGAIFIASSGSAQSAKGVYYFIDAFNVDSTSTNQDKIYLYSFPINSVLADSFDKEEAIAAFKQKVKSVHAVTNFSSVVIRMNDSYEEAESLMRNYVEKFTRRKYSIVKVE